MKEVIDQALHFGIGLVAAYVLSLAIQALAIPAIMYIAYRRELKQHKDDKLGAGSKRDLIFWFLGTVVGTAGGVFTLFTFF